MQGYIKDHRKELDSAIWMMPPLYHRTWQYLKYIVNHQDNTIPMRDGSFLTIKAGQHLTSVREIAKRIGWYEGVKWKEPNPKTMDTILKWMEKQSMIKIDRGKGNRQYTLITLLNWDLYQQNNHEGNGEVTDREHLADINKNDKECLKNDFTASANTHTPEESDGVPTTDPLRGDPVPSGEISHTSEHAEKILIDRFIQLRASGFACSPSDELAAKEILSSGVALQDALIYLTDRFETYKPKHPRDRINSLSYCVGYILDKHHNKLESQKTAKQTSTFKPGYRSKQNKPVRKEYLPDWFKKEDAQSPGQVNTEIGDFEAEKAKLEEELRQFKRVK